MFYNNESLLIEENVRNHFSKKNIKTFYRQAQEFVCLKGSNPTKQNYFIKDGSGENIQSSDAPKLHDMNKNSFFSVMDGSVKIIGLFDGHGDQGHNVSAAAMGIMLDYLRNKNDVIKRANLGNASGEDIINEIKKAFKYTQEVLREDYLINREINKQKKAQMD